MYFSKGTTDYILKHAIMSEINAEWYNAQEYIQLIPVPLGFCNFVITEFNAKSSKPHNIRRWLQFFKITAEILWYHHNTLSAKSLLNSRTSNMSTTKRFHLPTNNTAKDSVFRVIAVFFPGKKLCKFISNICKILYRLFIQIVTQQI